MSKKDKKKEKISDALAEGITELILTVIVGGIGFIICLGVGKLFSLKMDEIDLDLFVLIGIAGLAVIVLVFALIKTLIKKAKGEIKSQESLDDINN